MDELRNNTDVKDLLDTLEENGLHKEKGEVQSLVDYIENMETTLFAMLEEIKSLHSDVSQIHDNGLRRKCESIVHNAEGKIGHAILVVNTAKENFIKSASQALKTFKEKGKGALIGAVKAMRIPQALDSLKSCFEKFAASLGNEAQNLDKVRDELHEAGGHLKNAGRSFFGKSANKREALKSDKGILAFVRNVIAKQSKQFEKFGKKAGELSDRFRAAIVKDSVKSDLESFKVKLSDIERMAPDRVKDR